jgi:hypothetical protein
MQMHIGTDTRGRVHQTRLIVHCRDLKQVNIIRV